MSVQPHGYQPIGDSSKGVPPGPENSSPALYPNPFDFHVGKIADDPLYRLAALLAQVTSDTTVKVQGKPVAPQLLIAPIYWALTDYRERGPEALLHQVEEPAVSTGFGSTRPHPTPIKETSMLEHDTLILDASGQPYLSYGPRKMEPGSDRSVISCTPEEAEFWGVYAHPFHDVRASHMADAHDRDGARLLAVTMWRYRQARLGLDDLMTQLKGIGIADEVSDHGQWAGTEGLDFTCANRAIAQANIPTEQTFTEHGKGAPVDITGQFFNQKEVKGG